MTHVFDADAISGVLGHMNDDHRDDNLLIARAFGEPDAAAAAYYEKLLKIYEKWTDSLSEVSVELTALRRE